MDQCECHVPCVIYFIKCSCHSPRQPLSTTAYNTYIAKWAYLSIYINASDQTILVAAYCYIFQQIITYEHLMYSRTDLPCLQSIHTGSKIKNILKNIYLKSCPFGVVWYGQYNGATFVVIFDDHF